MSNLLRDALTPAAIYENEIGRPLVPDWEREAVFAYVRVGLRQVEPEVEGGAGS